MLIIDDWTAARFSGVVLSIGNFDGVHRGHRAIIDAGLRRARQAGTQLVVMTFEPHPSVLLTPDRVPPTLTPLDYKLDLLDQAGVDAVVVVKTSHDFLTISADQFVGDVVLGHFAPIAMVEGPTFGFGSHRRGNVHTLATAGPRHGFEVEIVEPIRVALGGHPETIVSSSLIRHLLASGTVDGAILCLGRPYSLMGEVARGVARGRTLGFPTANLDAITQMVPAEGVYAARAFLLEPAAGMSGPRNAPSHPTASPGAWGPPIAAAVSIGHNPTFDDQKRSIEAFLLDFEGDIYGRRIRLDFLDWLRPQHKFDTPQALIERIRLDVERTRQICSSTG